MDWACNAHEEDETLIKVFVVNFRGRIQFDRSRRRWMEKAEISCSVTIPFTSMELSVFPGFWQAVQQHMMTVAGDRKCLLECRPPPPPGAPTGPGVGGPRGGVWVGPGGGGVF
jgi:hypothetical protein